MLGAWAFIPRDRLDQDKGGKINDRLFCRGTGCGPA